MQSNPSLISPPIISPAVLPEKRPRSLGPVLSPMPLARIRQTCLRGHLLTMVLLASDSVTGEECGEVAGEERKATAHPLWNRQHLDTGRGREAGQRPLCPPSVFRSINTWPT